VPDVLHGHLHQCARAVDRHGDRRTLERVLASVVEQVVQDQIDGRLVDRYVDRSGGTKVELQRAAPLLSDRFSKPLDAALDDRTQGLRSGQDLDLVRRVQSLNLAPQAHSVRLALDKSADLPELLGAGLSSFDESVQLSSLVHQTLNGS